MSSGDHPIVDVIILDGAAIINMLKPVGIKTFQEYATLVFLPYIKSKLRNATRVDVIWDLYLPDSLKPMAREARKGHPSVSCSRQYNIRKLARMYFVPVLIRMCLHFHHALTKKQTPE